MPKLPERKTKHLRIGRVSVPGAIYFITICTANRKAGMTKPTVGRILQSAWKHLQDADNIDILCATIMPDHLHCLYRLGHTLSLSQVQAKFKTLTRDSMESTGLRWQSNFHDHKLRQSDGLEDFTFYIFMNPYAAGLADISEEWPWWTWKAKHKPEWMSKLKDGRYPHPEWLNQTPDSVRALDSAEF